MIYSSKRLPSVPEMLQQMQQLHSQEIDYSLERIQKLLIRLGNPQRFLPPTIHIAGTNGKGSTLAFLKNLLAIQGKRVHQYTSPHLIHFNERIELAGEPISDSLLQTYCQQVLQVNQNEPITFFEITTALAFQVFSQHPADYLLLETGMGGEFDATNLIDSPSASIIASISFDHESFLGDTLEEIAQAKAGIIKSGSPVIVGNLPNESVQMIMQETAHRQKAPLYRLGTDFHICSHQLILTDQQVIPIDNLGLKGDHQKQNVSLALCSLWAIQALPQSLNQIQQALSHTFWPGRFQKITDPALSSHHEWWLDGAHNAAGAQVVQEVIRNWTQPTVLVFTMKKDKDPVSFLQTVLPHVQYVFLVDLSESEFPFWSPDALESMIRSLRPSLLVQRRSWTEVQDWSAHQSVPLSFLMTGSLYWIGYILKQFSQFNPSTISS
jgi:dihydrofolate synthase/folylpolyglutamate synthase